mmetsp:Transcript_1309/g.5364  ORF Transcript_1309/g.5364 Transcript_1309/m.5364 type:complete len:168 (+) Transcript_1309:134-637(+)
MPHMRRSGRRSGRRSWQIRRLLRRKRSPRALPLGLQLHHESPCHPLEAADMCRHVEEVPECTEDNMYIQYLPFYYCSGVPRPLVMLLLAAWLGLVFFGLSTVAETFLCPALETASVVLKLPPDLAGVTLMAFAAGAPDVLTEVAAITHGAHADLHRGVAGPRAGGQL